MSGTIALLEEVLEFLEPYIDVSDGSYGEPRPNKAMSLTTAIEQEIERLKSASAAKHLYQFSKDDSENCAECGNSPFDPAHISIPGASSR